MADRADRQRRRGQAHRQRRAGRPRRRAPAAGTARAGAPAGGARATRAAPPRSPCSRRTARAGRGGSRARARAAAGVKYDPGSTGTGAMTPSRGRSSRTAASATTKAATTATATRRGRSTFVKNAPRPKPAARSMQVAIVSDIHGNRHAFEAVLADVARQPGARRSGAWATSSATAPIPTTAAGWRASTPTSAWPATTTSPSPATSTSASSPPAPRSPRAGRRRSSTPATATGWRR